MKKIMLALCLLSVCSGAFAYIQEGTTSDIQTMDRGPHSDEMLKIVDRVKYQAAGDDQNYELTYSRKNNYKNKYHFWYERAKVYLDPMADDDSFGFHDIDFSNKFYPLEKFYMPENLSEETTYEYESDSL